MISINTQAGTHGFSGQQIEKTRRLTMLLAIVEKMKKILIERINKIINNSHKNKNINQSLQIVLILTTSW